MPQFALGVETSLLRGFADELDRVDAAAVMQNLEMQVGAGRSACLAHQGHNLTLLDFVTDGNEILGVVGIARRVTAAMIYFDHNAVAVAIRRPGHDAVSHRNDLGTHLAGKINAGVVSRFTGEGVRALAEVG